MTTYPGADVFATFDGQVIGQLQSMSYSVRRESAPRYYMGNQEPHSFSRNITLDSVISEDSREDIRRQLAENLGVPADITFAQLARAMRVSMRYSPRGMHGGFGLNVEDIDYSILYPHDFKRVKSELTFLKQFVRPIEMDESKFTYVNPNNSHRSWKLNREEEVYYD